MTGSVAAMVIMCLVTAALAVPAFWLTMRYNMHMFQLNVYMNGEQRAWIRKNFHLQWILVFAMVLGIITMLVPIAGISWLTCVFIVLCWLTLAVIILVYRVMKQMNQKKKLVFTPRVKRMVTTIIVLCVLFLILSVFTGLKTVGPEVGSIESAFTQIPGMLTFLVGSQLWMQMLAKTINTPVEKGVNNHYINDAKAILRSNPDMTIIGVTGSYGKTSVKFFLQTLLQQKYSVLVTPESYNTPMGVVITIRKFMKPSHQIFICEMGARYVGEIREICDLVHPHHGIITSIGPQHLDTFGGIENVKKTKFELADALPEGGMLFLNGDNEYIADYLVQHGGYDNVTFYHSEGSGEGYVARDIKVSNLGTEFTVIAHWKN